MPGVKKTMGEYKRGTLRSGSGKKVTSRKQAVAIAMSQPKKRKPAKRRGMSEDQMWGAAKPVKKTAKKVSADARKKAQKGRLTAAERRKVTQRDKDRLMEQRAAVTRRRFLGSM